MGKLTFLGTCSGTEPMPNRHHSSIVLETNGVYYWFDAGENCSFKAHNMGIDISRVRAIFISHMHVDHIGGLANLLFTIQKLERITKKPHINNQCYDIFVPETKKLQCAREIGEVSANPKSGVRGIEHVIGDGLIFEDENIRVTAIHNTHLKETGENGWHAYSFLIEVEGKRIVFSGDVGFPEELDSFVTDGCDILVMETGHHKVSDVCAYANSRKVGKFLLTHHGREILRDVDAACQLVATLCDNAKICNDEDVVVF